MVFVLVFAICFLASTIGAICGIGGGDRRCYGGWLG